MKKFFFEMFVWKFWIEFVWCEIFCDIGFENVFFLLKWLVLVYIIEVLMVCYVFVDLIVSVLGGDGVLLIFLGFLVGVLVYLNGYVVFVLVDVLL